MVKYIHINDINFDRKCATKHQIADYAEILKTSRPIIPIQLKNSRASPRDCAYLCACESAGFCYIPVG